MIKPEQIPDAVVEAAARAMRDTYMKANDVPPYNTETHYPLSAFVQEARAAIAAALNAWPGAEVVEWYHADKTLILPLPQEASDD